MAIEFGKNATKSETIHYYYSIPSKKLIEWEIMEDDLPRGVENTRHFFVEDEGEEGLDGGAEPIAAAKID